MKSIVFFFVFVFLSLFAYGQQDTSKFVVYFSSDQSVLSSSEKSRLLSFIGEVPLARLHKVLLSGHTDADGDQEYNLKLSKQRSEYIRKQLIADSISPDKIQVRNFGETKPLAENDKEEEKARNRRVEVVVFMEAEQTGKEKISEPKATGIHDLYAKLQSPEQHFYIDAGKRKTKLCEKGAIIHLEPGAFLLDGKPVTHGMIKITVREVYSKSAVVMNNLSTQSSSNLLETEGMLYLNAESRGKQLSLNPQKRPELIVPAENYVAESKIFNGNRNKADSSMNWTVEPRDTLAGLYPVDLMIYAFDTKLFSSYSDAAFGSYTIWEFIFYNVLLKPFFITKDIMDRITTRVEEDSVKTSDSQNSVSREDVLRNSPMFRRLCRQVIKNKDQIFLEKANPALASIFDTLLNKHKARTLRELNDCLQDERMRRLEEDIENGEISYANMQAYMFKRSGLGWVNVDYFAKEYPENQLSSLTVKVKSRKNTGIKLVFREQDIIINGRKTIGGYKFNDIPEQSLAYLVGLRYEEEQPEVIIKEIQINGDTVIDDLNFHEVNIKQLKKKLKELDMTGSMAG